jgi:hypothetical protein
LPRGAESPDAAAELFVDVDHSGGRVVQDSDLRFRVGEDGSVSVSRGDGTGGYVAAGSGGLAGVVAASAVGWGAEMRIDAGRLGGWTHPVGLAVMHSAISAAGDNRAWPHGAAQVDPSTWATSVFGVLPVLTEIGPSSTVAGAAGLTLNMTGTGFISGTVALLNGAELATTLLDGERLTASVPAGQVATPGVATVSVRGPVPGALESNELLFVVDTMSPTVTDLTPDSSAAGSPEFTLSVRGSDFAADAEVMWNGTPLPTTVVDSGRLTALVDDGLLTRGQTVGISVRNRQPNERNSAVLSFLVVPRIQWSVYLPWSIIKR